MCTPVLHVGMQDASDTACVWVGRRHVWIVPAGARVAPLPPSPVGSTHPLHTPSPLTQTPTHPPQQACGPRPGWGRWRGQRSLPPTNTAPGGCVGVGVGLFCLSCWIRLRLFEWGSGAGGFGVGLG